MTRQQTSTNTFGVAKWVVSADATQGTHTTIASATTAAASGDTIWIRDGTYTEDFSAKAGVTYTCGSGDGNSGNVVIVGNITCTGTGTFTFSNLRLQTNSANCLTVSGSSVTVVKLNNVYVNCSNNTGISYTTSNSSSTISVINCTFDLTTTGIAYYSMTSTGSINNYRCDYENSGGSSTASNNSAGSVFFSSSTLGAPISTSSTGFVQGYNSFIFTPGFTCITTAGSSAVNSFVLCSITSTSASAISIGTGTTLNCENCQINSSNTNAITGAGTITYSGLSFQNSAKINTTTQTGGLLNGGVTQAPSAGFIGEQIRSAVASGSPVSLTVSTTVYDITSISLTAGIWDVSGLVIFSAGAVTGTNFTGGLSATSATLGTAGDQRSSLPTPPTAGAGVGFSIPSYRVVTTTTINYYLNASATFTVGSPTAFGRISATRVG